MALLIEIGHVKRDWNLPQTIPVYIGRGMPGMEASVLGNPFKISPQMNRGEVVKAYRVWLWERIKEGGDEYRELTRLLELARSSRGKVLLLRCWCRSIDQESPECHGDVIEKALQWMNVQNLSEKVG